MTFDDLNALYPVKSLLENIGLRNIKEKEDYFIFSSPFRKDTNPSMALYKSNLFCLDFAGDYRASLHGLIKELTGETLYSYTNIDPAKLSSSVFRASLRTDDRSHFIEERPPVKQGGILYPVSHDSLASFYAKERFLFLDFQEAFNIKMSYDATFNGTPFRNRICIPVVQNKKLLSMEGRDYTRRQKPKVLYPKGGTVSTLFNLDNLDKKAPLVIVEGILDMPKIWKFFTKNVTTTFGVMITSKQKELLLQFDDIILFSDGDEAGEEMISSFDNFYDQEFRVARIEGKDPGDAFTKEIGKALDNAVTSGEYFLNKSNLFEKPKVIDFFS
jgi:hypothetical protein